MRQANREHLLSGRFEVIADRFFEEQPVKQAEFEGGEASNLEQFLVAWASLRLNRGLPVDPSNSLPAYGLDSIRAVELSEETKNIFGFEWHPSLFFEEISISQLASEGIKLMDERQGT